jgi:hypothetical protein
MSIRVSTPWFPAKMGFVILIEVLVVEYTIRVLCYYYIDHMCTIVLGFGFAGFYGSPNTIHSHATAFRR